MKFATNKINGIVSLRTRQTRTLYDNLFRKSKPRFEDPQVTQTEIAAFYDLASETLHIYLFILYD